MAVFSLCLHMVFLLWASNTEVSLYARISSSYKHICYIALGPILMASFYSAPFKSPCLLIRSHAKLLGLSLHHMNFRVAQFSPQQWLFVGFRISEPHGQKWCFQHCVRMGQLGCCDKQIHKTQRLIFRSHEMPFADWLGSLLCLVPTLGPKLTADNCIWNISGR